MPQPTPVTRIGANPMLVGFDREKLVVVAIYGTDVSADERDRGVVTLTQSAEVTP